MTGSDGQPCDSVCASLGCTDGCNADGPGVPSPVAGSDGQHRVDVSAEGGEATAECRDCCWGASGPVQRVEDRADTHERQASR